MGILWLFLAELLPKTQYGELGLLFSWMNVAVVISILGLRSTVLVYELKNKNVFYTSLVTILISSCAVAILTFVFKENISLSILIIGVAVFDLLISGLNVHKQYKKIAKFRILRALITVILVIVLYQVIGINGILFGFFIPTLFILTELPRLIKNQKIEFSKLSSKINFIIPVYSHRLTGVAFRWGDKLLIGTVFGLTTLANYHFAAQVFFLLEMIPISIQQYLTPRESEGIKNKGLKKVFIIIACLITLFVIFSSPFFVNAFIPKYQESIPVIQIMSIAIIPLSISAIQTSEFLGKENSRIVLIGSIIQFSVYFVLILILGGEYGLIGFAFGFLIAVSLRTIFNYYVNITQKGLKS